MKNFRCSVYGCFEFTGAMVFVFHLSQKMGVVCRILFGRVGFARVLRLRYMVVEKIEETD